MYLFDARENPRFHVLIFVDAGAQEDFLGVVVGFE
jgi:hypothetical protein